MEMGGQLIVNEVLPERLDFSSSKERARENSAYQRNARTIFLPATNVNRICTQVARNFPNEEERRQGAAASHTISHQRLSFTGFS